MRKGHDQQLVDVICQHNKEVGAPTKRPSMGVDD